MKVNPTLTRVLFYVLLVLNLQVLMGQLWPEGAPPFAGIVNKLTLILNILALLIWVRPAIAKNHEGQ